MQSRPRVCDAFVILKRPCPPEPCSVPTAFKRTCLHLHLAIRSVQVVFLQSVWAVPDVMERLPNTMEKAMLKKSADTVMYLIDVLR